MDGSLEIRVLGPVEVLRAGEPVPLGGPRVRALLAYLVLHHTSAVPTERILTELWGPDAGEGARRSLHTQVSTLRRRLAAPNGSATIEHDSSGYWLHAPGASIDLHEFERLSDVAIATHDGRAAAQALELWRGSPLQEIASEPWAHAIVTELHERWMQVLLADLDARLDDGDHRELGPRLKTLIGEHPFAEPLWERQMLALYRSGRQTDALEAYRQLEEILREELGLVPSPPLQRLQRRILVHDPGLLLSSSGPHEVPGGLATFVGRDAELGWLASLVDDHRLITVLGPGGVGKTRTAIEMAHRHRGRYTGGIWFVDLAPVRQAGRVVELLAQQLGLQAAPGQELSAACAHFGDRDALLVLDNCEHLRVEVARVVAELLASTASLRLLVTSRVALGVPSEVNWVLPPLEIPKEADDLASTEQRDAVRLFVDRATSVRPAFQLGTTNVRTVAHLCRRLDGLPLALELAATRLRSMGVSEIAALLDRDLDMLRSPDPNVDDRHRTLSAVLTWSTDLLDEATRVAHARLAVLPGSFETSLAAAVTGTSEITVADHLDTLVASSLLTADTTEEHTRYRMLEVVRDHAAALMNTTGDRGLAERGLLAWALQLTERPRVAPDSSERSQGLHLLPSGWITRLATEQHNLRAALAAGTHDPASTLTLAVRLTRYWWANAGNLDPSSAGALPAVREGIGWLERLLALPGTDEALRDRAQVALGFLRTVSGDRQRALTDLLAVRDRLDARGQLRPAGWASMYAGTASIGLVPAAETTRLYHEARQRFEQTDEYVGRVLLTGLEFSHAMSIGDAGGASAVLDRFGDVTDASASPSTAPYRYLPAVWQALLDGDESAAAALLRPVHDEPPDVNDPVTTIILLSVDAWWAALAGHEETAARLLAICDAIESRSGLDLHFVHVLRDRANRALTRGADEPPSRMAAEGWTEETVLDAFAAVRSHLAVR